MVFNNLAGATFDAQSDDTFQFTTATFNNAGTLLKSGGTGLSRFLTAMNNTGTVHAQAGTLELGGGGSSSGSFQIDTDSTLRLSAGTHVFNAGWSVTGEGNLLVSGGTLDAASSGSIDNLELGNSPSAFLTGDGDVTVDGLFTWTGGRLQGTGTLIADGGMLIEGSSTKYLERTVDNTGTATWTGGTISATAEGVFNNLVGATFDAQSNNSISGTFNNAGTLLKSAGTSFSSFSTMNNTGLVQVQIGTLAVSSGGGNSSGSFQVDTDGTLGFLAGTHVWDANSTLSGAGTLNITNNATLDVASNISIGSLDVLSSSSSSTPILTGSGNVTVDGLFHWTGGRLQGSGKLIAGGGMLIDGSETKYQDRTIDNGGVATWTDGEIRASAGMVFNNSADATFDAQSDDTFQFTTATFNNAGTLLKSAGTGLSRFFTAMNNTGTVQVQSGTLELRGDGSSSGGFQIDTDSTLRLSAGTHVFHADWSVTGEGNLLVSGGTLDAASSGSIDNLELGNSPSAFLTGDGDVTVDGLFTWTGGRLQGTGTLIADGGMLIEGSSTKYLERTVDNTGTATWTGGTISATAEGVFNNLVGATFDAQSNNSISGTFNNAGTLLKSAGTSFSSFSTMNNTGLVQVQIGTLAVSSGGGNSSGSFQVDTDGTLGFLAGTHVWDANATLSGAGTLNITNNATLDVASNISIGSLDVLSSSSSSTPILTGSGNVTVDGLFHWTGGRLQGSGKLIAGGGMLIDGSQTMYLERTVDNGGVATWTDGEIRASAGMVFNNSAGATFDAQSDDTFQFTTATFNNAGTLLKSAGTGLSRFFTAMNNTGTVQVQSGTLELRGDGSSSGGFQIDTDSTLRLSAGTHVFHADWSVTGEGNLLVSGGTLDAASSGSIDNLELGSSPSAFLTGDGDVTVDGLFTWTGGRLQGTGTLIADGGMLIEGSSTKYLERTVDNTGTATWTGGTISATAEGVFNNLVGATFDAQSNNSISGTFNNAGTLLKSAGTSFSSFSTMNNTGSVQVQIGTLAVSSGGGNSSGSFQVDTDGTLRFLAGTHVWDANATLSGAGTLNITNNATLDVASNISIGSLDVLSSSSSSTPILTGSGNVTVDGLFHWTGGRLQGSGKLIAGGGMLIDGSQTKYLERTVDNGGVATWTDGEIRASAGMVFNNLAGATFDAQSDDTFQFTTATFNNAGTLLKSAGTGLSRFFTAMNNTGTVQVQSGTLAFGSGGATQTAGETVLDGGAITSTGPLNIQGGVLAGSGSFTGPLEFGDGAVLSLEINGPAAGQTATDYDQVNLFGTFTIGNNVQLAASSSNGFEPTLGQQLVLVNNDGTDPIVGDFDGLPEGAILTNFLGSSLDAQITYLGLDGSTGNDVVLTIFKDNRAPSANAGGPYVLNEGASSMLDASASADLNEPNSGLTFEWDLDYDGNTFQVDTTGETPPVSFPDNFATRSIALRVTDSEGDSDMATTTLTVSNVAPTATITGTPVTAVEGDTISLGSTIFDPGILDTQTIAWSVTKDGDPYGSGNDPTFDFTPDNIGTYEVTLTVTDNDGGVGIETETITVNSAAPMVILDPSLTVVKGVAFTLDGSFTDPGSDDWTATVNYGDGTGDQSLVLAGTTFQLNHTYDTVGFYIAIVTIDDGDGGVTEKSLTVEVQLPPLADLTLISSDVLFDPINPNVGEPVDFVIDVSNAGTLAANNVSVRVQVYDAVTETFLEIRRDVIASISAESEAEITLTWDGTGSQPPLPSEDAYLLVRVELDPDNTIEEKNESNNETIQVLQVGSPDFGTASLVANVPAFTTTRGTYTAVGGQAYYDFTTIFGFFDFPVQNASVTARLIDQDSGEVLRVSGAQTAPNGNFLHFMRAPEEEGVYTLRYEVNEGTLNAVFETTLTVEGEPVVTPPRPRGPAGPGYVFSPSIVPPENPQIGVPVTILGSFDYDLDQPLLNVPVTFNNLFPVAGQLRTFEIGSGLVSFPDGGLDEPTTLPMEWIPTAEGYHILQVIAEPDFEFRAHTHVTQLVLVGDLDTTSLNRRIRLSGRANDCAGQPAGRFRIVW